MQPTAQPTPSGLPIPPTTAPDAPTALTGAPAIPGAPAYPSGASGGYPAPWGQAPYAAPGLPPALPAPPPPGAPQPHTPGLTTSLRLTGLAVALIVLITIIAATSPFAVASARTLAYPHPTIGIGVSGSSANIHIGDTVSFTANVVSGHDLTYLWDFGDGATATGAHANHVFQQNGQTTVSLTATDPIGQSAHATQNLNILFAAPTASFTYTADANYVCGIDFDASASTGQFLNYSWNFGDGDTSTDQAPTENFPHAGSYTVSLIVTDGDNQTATDTQTVAVNCAAQPTASFTYSPDPNLTCGIDFDASASTGNSLTYSWDFGDGSTGYGQTTTNYYTQAGSYTVVLTVTDQFNQTATQSQAITVTC